MVGRDRGQLILVGAVAIALVLLGLVLIVNTALFTQIVGSEGTTESVKASGVSGQEIGESIAAIVAAENRIPSGDPISNVVDDTLEPAFANRTIESSGAFVSLSYLGMNETGTLVYQDTPTEVTSTAGPGDWSPVTDGDVGHFTITVDAANSSGETFDVNVTPVGGTATTLTVTVNGAGDQVDLTGAGQSGCSAIPATNGTIRIDVRHGHVFEAGSCHFELFEGTTPPYEVRFERPDSVNATYEIATDGTVGSGIPNSRSIVWSFFYSFEYDTTGTTTESDRRGVDVYD